MTHRPESLLEPEPTRHSESNDLRTEPLSATLPRALVDVLSKLRAGKSPAARRLAAVTRRFWQSLQLRSNRCLRIAEAPQAKARRHQCEFSFEVR